MAAGPKQFCAVALPSGVLTDLYTAPLEAVVSTLVVCNRGATATSFRLSHAPGGTADALSQYFAYDLPIAASTMVPFTMGICLQIGDVLRGYAANANLTVTAWGEEQGVNGDMGASFFVELADTPASYTGEAGKAVLVNPTENGLVFGTVDTSAGAPVDAEFIVATTNAVLTGERVLTNTATVTWDFTTAGQAKATAVVPSSYTNEDAQDAVGTILVDSATIDFTYTDATPSITAAVIAGSITTTHLGNDQVTYPKIQNVADNRLLGRSAGSAGVMQEIQIGTGLSLSAGTLTSTITQYDNETAQDAIGTILVDSTTIDLTYNDTTPSITAAVIAGSIGTTQLTDANVTYAKIQNMATARLLGRTTAANGVIEEIAVGSGLSLTALALGIANDGVTTLRILNANVTYAKIQNVTDARLLGRSSGSAGPPIEITVGTGLSLAAGALTSTVVVDPFRLGHTWALVGDATLYTTLPSIFVPMLGTQAAVLYGIRTKLGSGTSIGVQVRRNGGNVGGVITVTTTATTTTLGNVALADNDELTIVLSAPVGTPSNLTATIIIEHTP